VHGAARMRISRVVLTVALVIQVSCSGNTSNTTASGADAGTTGGSDGTATGGGSGGEDAASGGRSQASGGQSGGSTAGSGGSNSAGMGNTGGATGAPCPEMPPQAGAPCAELGQTCAYEDCAGGGRTIARCQQQAWSIDSGTCEDTVFCNNIQCDAGQICLTVASGALLQQCVENTCGSGPVGCDCIDGCSGECVVVGSASGIHISCNACPSGLCP
jgi:hypothetical protein